MALDSYNLNEDREKALVKLLEESMEECASHHQDWSDDKALWMRYYLTQPEQTYVDYPWPHASNLQLPVIRIAIDGLMSQYWEAMFGNDPFIDVKAVSDPASIATAEALAVYYDQFYNRVINYKAVANDWMFSSTMDGVGVCRNRAVLNRRIRREVSSKRTPVLKMMDSPLGRIPQIGGYKETTDERVYMDESIDFHVENLDTDRLYVPPDAGPSLQWPETPYYYVESWMSKEQLVCRRAQGWANIDEKLFAKAETVPDTEKEAALKDSMGLSGTAKNKIRVLEFYRRLVLPHEDIIYTTDGKTTRKTQRFLQEDGVPEECIVFYFPATKKVARVVPLDRVRLDGKRPDVDMRFGRLPGSFYSPGLPARMMDLQEGHTTFFNMMVDLGRLVNFPWIFGDVSLSGDGGFIDLEPGKIIPTMGGRVETFRPNGDPGFYGLAMQMLQAWEEKDGNVTDFSLGVTPSRPNSPRTYRGTQALLNQAQIAFAYRVSQMAERHEELFRQVHAMHQKFPPDAQELRMDEKRTMLVLPGMFKTPVDLRFVVNPNRNYEIETALQLFSVLGPAIVQATGNPLSIRPLAKELYMATKRGNNANFDEIFPLPAPPEVSTQPGQVPPQAQPGPQATNAPVPFPQPQQEAVA